PVSARFRVTTASQVGLLGRERPISGSLSGRIPANAARSVPARPVQRAGGAASTGPDGGVVSGVIRGSWDTARPGDDPGSGQPAGQAAAKTPAPRRTTSSPVVRLRRVRLIALPPCCGLMDSYLVSHVNSPHIIKSESASLEEAAAWIAAQRAGEGELTIH